MARTRYQQNETHCHRRTSEGIAFGENSSSILPCCFSRVVCRLALVFSSGTRSTGLRCCGRTWTRVSRTLDCRMLIWFNCTILSPWCLLRTRSKFLLSARRDSFGNTIKASAIGRVQNHLKYLSTGHVPPSCAIVHCLETASSFLTSNGKA